MRSSLKFREAFGIALVLALGFTGVQARAELLLNGAGATFPYPLYSKWFSEYAKHNPAVKLNYQSIGSGGGVRQLLDQTIDFGASDAPMTDEQLSKAKQPVLHIPTALGSVVITYNLPELKKPLNLDGAVIAEIFLGKIKKWNDPKIAALNPGVSLPVDEAILVAHRSDGSGTTAVFADYLSKVSPDWKSQVGAGTSLSWPTGLGGKGNEGVTGLVKQTPGSMGYVELVYALSNGLPTARVKNAAGKMIEASPKSTTAAAAAMKAKDIPSDLRMSITNASGKDSYPIASFTYILVYEKMKKEKGEKIKEFLHWALGHGQSYNEALGYAQVPKSIRGRAEGLLKKIQWIE